MELSTSNVRRMVGGTAAALAAVAIAVPAISSADRGHGHDGHGGETVGTVDSFDATTGMLTIDPMSGDPVSGLVTDRTKIQCRNQDVNDDDNVGDDHGDDGPNHDVGDNHGDDNGSSSHGKRSHGGRRGNCSPDALVTGAAVEDADLDLGPNGLTFEEVELR
jgi:hypothetical protein